MSETQRQENPAERERGQPDPPAGDQQDRPASREDFEQDPAREPDDETLKDIKGG